MVKFHRAQTTYPHPFPAVSLAYFLRYPNPYSTHVLSTDTISRHLDPETGRLHTVRLHLKQSKLPSAVLKLLPSGILGGGTSNDGQARNFILETTVVDPHEGWMETETRNLQYTGVLSVVEQQRFARPNPQSSSDAIAPIGIASALSAQSAAQELKRTDLRAATKGESTDVSTTVTFVSRFGQAARKRAAAAVASATEEEQPSRGIFQSWSTAALQRTIEASGVQRTRNALVKSREGMLVVLDRIRSGGLVGALEGMRKDRELMLAGVAGETLQRNAQLERKKANDKAE